MSKKWSIALAVLLAVGLLSGCGSGGGITGDNSGDGATVKVSGAAQKGPFVINSKVEVQPLSKAGQPTGEPFITETVDSIGNFEFETNHPGPLQIAVEGYHLNELTGNLSSGILRLQGVFAGGKETDQQAFVNVLTHLICQRVLYLVREEGIEAAEATAQAQLEFIEGFKPVIEHQIAIERFDHLSVYDVEGTEYEGNAYLLLTSAALYQYATAQSMLNDTAVDAELTALLNSLANDLKTDGSFDQPQLLQAIKLALTELDRASIEANLITQSKNILGSPLAVPNIERYMNQILIVFPADDAEVSSATDIRLALPSGLTDITYTLLIDGEVVDVVDAEPYQFQWNPYYWSSAQRHTLVVQAEDADGVRVHSNLINVSIPAAGGMLSGTWPDAGGSIKDSDRVRLSWTGLGDAAGYEMQVAIDPDFSAEHIVHIGTSTLNEFVTPGLMKGRYYWRVRASNALGKFGGWSEPRDFSISGPDVPSNFAASSEEMADGYRVGLSWDALPEAVSYLVEVAKDADFIVSRQSFTSEVASAGFDAVLGKYYWRVKAVNGAGMESGWSSVGEVGAGLFSWRFGSADDDYAVDMVQADQGFVVAGSRNNDIVVMCIDRQGQFLWEKTIGGSQTDRPLGLSLIADGGVVVSGYTYGYNDHPDTYGRFPREIMVKLNSLGEEEWQILGQPNGISTGDNRFQPLTDPPLQVHDGRLLWLRASQGDVGEISYDLVEIDDNGQEVSVVALPRPRPGLGLYTAGNLLPTEGGDFVISGMLLGVNGPYDGTPWNSIVYVQKTSVDGTVVWCEEVSAIMSSNSMIELANGTLILRGYAFTFESIVSLSSEGKFLGKVEYDSMEVSFDSGKDIVAATEVGFSVVGEDQWNKSYPYPLVMLNFDSELNEVSRYDFGGIDGYVKGRKIIDALDGGFLVFGWYKSSQDNDKYDFLLIKTDKNGNFLPIQSLDVLN